MIYTYSHSCGRSLAGYDYESYHWMYLVEDKRYFFFWLTHSCGSCVSKSIASRKSSLCHGVPIYELSRSVYIWGDRNGICLNAVLCSKTKFPFVLWCQHWSRMHNRWRTAVRYAPVRCKENMLVEVLYRRYICNCGRTKVTQFFIWTVDINNTTWLRCLLVLVKFITVGTVYPSCMTYTMLCSCSSLNF